MARRSDGRDRWYLEALGLAADGHEDALYSALLPLLGHTDPVAWDPRFAQIAWRLHPPAAIDAFKVRAASSALTADARRQALVALGFTNDRRAAQAMAELTQAAVADTRAGAAWWMAYRSANDWRGYRVDGWTAAIPESKPASLDEMHARRALVVETGAPIDRRIEAALAMARDATGGQLLIQLAAENKLAYQLREAVGSLIFDNPDRTGRAAAAGYFQRPGGQARLPAADVATLPGDPARGQARFLVNCATCHRRDGVGAETGPDLTDIDKKFDRRGIVESFVNPNAAIAFGYGAELFAMRTGLPQIGFLQADGATVSIKTSQGQVMAVARDDLAARVPLKSSLMPDPVMLGMTDQDVADIAAFLMQR